MELVLETEMTEATDDSYSSLRHRTFDLEKSTLLLGIRKSHANN